MKKNKDTKKSRALSWLFGRTKGYRLKIFALTIISAVSAILAVAFALLCKSVIDKIAYNGGEGFLSSGVFLLCVLLISAFLDWLSDFMTQKMKQNMIMELRDEVLLHIFKSNYGQISKYHSGDLINRLLSDVQICAEGCADLIPSLTFMVVKFILASIVLTVIAGNFIWVFVLACFAVAGIMMFAKGKIQNFHKGVQERYAENQSFLQESLSCILPIKAFDAESRIKDEFASRQRNFMDFRLRRWIFHSSAKTGFRIVVSIAYLAAIIFGCWGISNNIFTFGSFIAILQLLSEVQSPLSEIPFFLSKYFSVLASVDRILEIKDIPSECGNVGERESVYEKIKEIKVKDVRFSYGENQVLKGAFANFKKGETTAVTGESGCGKSTLFLLLLGAYEPESGSICLDFGDEKAVHEKSIGAYRKLFSYVPQGNYIFMGTIKDNITLFDNSVSDDECITALKLSCAWEFVEKMQGGIYANLKEKGKGLSVGQLQRLTIARAILSKAPILLLDEATCSLDDKTEKRVLENIKSLKGKTIIIVTHGKEALNICDRVYEMKNGIMEQNIMNQQVVK